MITDLKGLGWWFGICKLRSPVGMKGFITWRISTFHADFCATQAFFGYLMNDLPLCWKNPLFRLHHSVCAFGYGVHLSLKVFFFGRGWVRPQHRQNTHVVCCFNGWKEDPELWYHVASTKSRCRVIHQPYQHYPVFERCQAWSWGVISEVW